METPRAWLGPLLRGLAAVLVVASAGGCANATVWALSVAAGVTMADLARRECAERARDASGFAMQAAFVAVLAGAAFDRRHGVPAAGLVDLLGATLFAAAFGLRQLTQREMGEAFRVAIVLTSEQELVQTGPFRVIRHPSYAAIGLMGIATSLLTRSPLALVATFVLWLPAAMARISIEEQGLARRYGARWTEYCRTTGRLLPHLRTGRR